jgi:hypothetical protein
VTSRRPSSIAPLLGAALLACGEEPGFLPAGARCPAGAARPGELAAFEDARFVARGVGVYTNGWLVCDP